MKPRYSAVQALSHFAQERHRIYLRRRAGEPGPWTQDPILRDNRFCNVFRELDTVTIWIRKNIRERYADHPHLWFMLCIARYINWPTTLQYLQDYKVPGPAWPTSWSFNPRFLTAALEDFARGHTKTYTGAYMIRAESDPNKPWYSWTKHRYIAEIVLGRLWEDSVWWNGFLMDPDRLLQSVWETFQQPRYVGWGPFMAYEVVTDLRHTRYLRNAPDIYTWANAGPGAIRGLNRLFGRDLKAHPPAAQTCEEMRGLMGVMNMYPELWPKGDPDWPALEMRDVEHLLCEFDKYERVRSGDGKMRAKYDWRKAEPLTT